MTGPQGELAAPLPPGTVLADRFEILGLVGQGQFALNYLARDLTRRDDVIVRELAPLGIEREENGRLELEAIGEAAAHRLRHRFIDEARAVAKLNISGIPAIRAWGEEHGTAFFVREHFADALPLDQLLARDGRFSEVAALDVLYQLLEILIASHGQHRYHQAVRPSNVLMTPNGRVWLADFGVTRSWYADLMGNQTVLYTSGCSPLELISDRAIRDERTDLYCLCALTYTLLAGFSPPPAIERQNGVVLMPLGTLRPDLEKTVAQTLELGLGMRPEDRPRTLEALRSLLENERPPIPHSTLDAHDLRLLRMRSLAYLRHQCPSCGGLLQSPKPLGTGVCPVCRHGRIRTRDLSARLCASCGVGVLKDLNNTEPLAICPCCRHGVFLSRRQGLISKLRSYSCPQCLAELTEIAGGLVRLQLGPDKCRFAEGTEKTWPEWAQETNRASVISVCEGCAAQFDHLEDGQWVQMWPLPPRRARGPSHFPEEWARIAKGLGPEVGSHVCDHCQADYFVEDDHVTLLGANDDPFGFDRVYGGRLLHYGDLRWLGVGKTSLRPGLVCLDCFTEFDTEGKELFRLVRTENRSLRPWLDELHGWPDWHRLAQELPRAHEAESAEASLRLALVDAFRQGELDLDGQGSDWKGPAEQLDEDGNAKRSGELLVRAGQWSFGGWTKRERFPLELLATTDVEDDVLLLVLRGEAGQHRYRITEIEMTVRLKSGEYSVRLSAADLEARIRHAKQAIGPR